MSEGEFEFRVSIAEENRSAEEEAELEEMIVAFTPEPSICHDVYPDSGFDEECDVINRAIVSVNRNKNFLQVGYVFSDKEAFAEAILDHALKHGRNIKQYRYDKTKIGFCCVGGNCDWKVYCGKIARSDGWKLRVYKSKHSCVPNGECELMKVPIIAALFRDKSREDPDYYMPMKIEEMIMEKWKIKVTRGQCQVVRMKALKWIEAEYDLQFERLRDYAVEIRETNPNSTVEVETVRNEEGLGLYGSL